jgi:hypothetical protein
MRSARLWVDVTVVAAGMVVLLVPLGLLAAMRRVEVHRRSNETQALCALKAIFVAQALFSQRDLEGDGAHDHGTLRELADAGLIDAALGSGEVSGYRFQVRPSARWRELAWFAVANPVRPGTTGDRSFCINQAGVLLYTGVDGGAISLADFGDDGRPPASLMRVGK